jgi:hypothetical protein
MYLIKKLVLIIMVIKIVICSPSEFIIKIGMNVTAEVTINY